MEAAAFVELCLNWALVEPLNSCSTQSHLLAHGELDLEANFLYWASSMAISFKKVIYSIFISALFHNKGKC